MPSRNKTLLSEKYAQPYIKHVATLRLSSISIDTISFHGSVDVRIESFDMSQRLLKMYEL